MKNIHPVRLGDYTFDGNHIYIQSMLNTEAHDIEGSVAQAVELEKAGCEIIRAAIPDMDAVKLIPALKEKISVPLVADIHFDYRLALAAAQAGIDKIRINPGNIGELLERYGSPTPEALVESAMRHVKILEELDFEDTVISIKSSNVPTMIKAYRLCRKRCAYPLHLGVTEAGTERMGLIKSAAGIGSLLVDGIGETIRVSLTDSPVKEIAAAKDILKAVGKGSGVEIVSCPTCGRTQIDLIGLANRVEDATRHLDKNIKIAVMGCIVNGIGEGREADIGIAGGKGKAVIFKKGEKLCTVDEKDALTALLAEIEKL